MAASQNSLQGSLFEGDSVPLITKNEKAQSSKTSKENINKIKEIAKLNKVLINPQFSVVDPLKSKI